MDRILGITAEYDPFHSGHAYHLRRAREEAAPDAVVCVMSGNFTQRGEPAVLDKWTRAAIAVQQGADLVFELPFMYACDRAERFAAGAVDLLVSAGATHISFGCEAEQPEDLEHLAEGQLAGADQIAEMTAGFMKDGYSRVKAAELASRQLFGDGLTDLMLTPNNVLALEYLKRIRWWEEAKGVAVRSVPVRRYGSGYAEADQGSGYAGGTALRQMIAAGQDVATYLPYDRGNIVWNDLPAARRRMYEILRGILLRTDPAQLADIYCIGEGMEHRLLREARQKETYEDFLPAMVSKRYTAAAIRRIMIYILMNIGEMPACSPYGRVLAANGTGRRLLRQIEARTEEGADAGACASSGPGADARREDDRQTAAVRAQLTVIANMNRLAGVTEPVRRALALDSKATDMFNLISGRSPDECSDQRQHPYIRE